MYRKGQYGSIILRVLEMVKTWENVYPKWTIQSDRTSPADCMSGYGGKSDRAPAGERTGSSAEVSGQDPDFLRTRWSVFHFNILLIKVIVGILPV